MTRSVEDDGGRRQWLEAIVAHISRNMGAITVLIIFWVAGIQAYHGGTQPYIAPGSTETNEERFSFVEPVTDQKIMTTCCTTAIGGYRCRVTRICLRLGFGVYRR
ncbi:hypothetical protein BD410DRAFT_794282 [Rickenella mellea]|uniref:Uncharacterized protein n=1 Tax=Rickenella mellea TaxID=50990 RepID=A0A4Y7PQR4_9AGAM|nr:hypothetical protein BD410DRAFT_794282 [Rickenella mellea]